MSYCIRIELPLKYAQFKALSKAPEFWKEATEDMIAWCSEEKRKMEVLLKVLGALQRGGCDATAAELLEFCRLITENPTLLRREREEVRAREGTPAVLSETPGGRAPDNIDSEIPGRVAEAVPSLASSESQPEDVIEAVVRS